MDRKEIARETLRIQEQGSYEYEGRLIDVSREQRRSEETSLLITPERGAEWVEAVAVPSEGVQARRSVANEATVKAITDFAKSGRSRVGVLNFASAKNPGGGFLNGAMAQEERVLYGEPRLRVDDVHRLRDLLSGRRLFPRRAVRFGRRSRDGVRVDVARGELRPSAIKGRRCRGG